MSVSRGASTLSFAARLVNFKTFLPRFLLAILFALEGSFRKPYSAVNVARNLAFEEMSNERFPLLRGRPQLG